MSEDIAPQLKRLDVEHGDLLVLRTARKLTAEQAKNYQDELIRMCAHEGVHRVTVLVLDDCTDLTVERPARLDTRMAHQRTPALPIVSC